jgi:hypothetical protein
MSQMSDYDDDDDDLPLPPIRKRNERALFSKVCVTIRIAKNREVFLSGQGHPMLTMMTSHYRQQERGRRHRYLIKFVSLYE